MHSRYPTFIIRPRANQSHLDSEVWGASFYWFKGYLATPGELSKWIFMRLQIRGCCKVVIDLQYILFEKSDALSASLMPSCHLISDAGYNTEWGLIFVTANWDVTKLILGAPQLKWNIIWPTSHIGLCHIASITILDWVTLYLESILSIVKRTSSNLPLCPIILISTTGWWQQGTRGQHILPLS